MLIDHGLTRPQTDEWIFVDVADLKGRWVLIEGRVVDSTWEYRAGIYAWGKWDTKLAPAVFDWYDMPSPVSTGTQDGIYRFQAPNIAMGEPTFPPGPAENDRVFVDMPSNVTQVAYIGLYAEGNIPGPVKASNLDYWATQDGAPGRWTNVSIRAEWNAANPVEYVDERGVPQVEVAAYIVSCWLSLNGEHFSLPGFEAWYAPYLGAPQIMWQKEDAGSWTLQNTDAGNHGGLKTYLAPLEIGVGSRFVVLIANLPEDETHTAARTLIAVVDRVNGEVRVLNYPNRILAGPLVRGAKAIFYIGAATGSQRIALDLVSMSTTIDASFNDTVVSGHAAPSYLDDIPRLGLRNGIPVVLMNGDAIPVSTYSNQVSVSGRNIIVRTVYGGQASRGELSYHQSDFAQLIEWRPDRPVLTSGDGTVEGYFS